MAVMSTAMENLAERDGDGWRIADSARQRRWPIWQERPRPPGSAGLKRSVSRRGGWRIVRSRFQADARA